jgi:lathosterol oxidase
MDIVLAPLNKHLLTPYVFPAHVLEDDLARQCATVFVFLNMGAALLYFVIGGFVYTFLFDKDIRNHPRFLPDQERTEIGYAVRAIPWIALYSTPIFVAELRGYSKLYDDVGGDYAYLVKSVLLFTAWNDFAVYWVHRALHLPFLYKHVHKVHHIFKVHTPWAALAFTPMDGFSQSVPYHLFVFLIRALGACAGAGRELTRRLRCGCCAAPAMHKLTYLVSFVMLQLWTICIHDHFYVIPLWLDPIVNGSAHHSDHHAHFNFNHGLYFTFWDRVGGTHRTPSATSGNGPLDEIRKLREQGKLPPKEHAKAA